MLEAEEVDKTGMGVGKVCTLWPFEEMFSLTLSGRLRGGIGVGTAAAKTVVFFSVYVGAIAMAEPFVHASSNFATRALCKEKGS
jgi:hypothetical protein